MYFTYILQSLKDQSFYIGFTSNLEQRLKKHNNSSSGYTSTKKPWKIVYFESFDIESKARKRELAIKKKKSRKYIEYLISQWKGPSVD